MRTVSINCLIEDINHVLPKQDFEFILGSYGFTIRAFTGLDLTDSDSVNFILKKPSGTEVTLEASVSDNPYYCQYTIASTDLNEEGEYYLQVEAIFLGKSLFSKSGKFFVSSPFQDTGIY